jgi:predicted metalloprotease
MAFWDRIGSTGNVEDRRGTGLALGGGTALAGIAIYIVLSLLGVNVDPALLNQVLGSTQNQDTSQYAGKDQYEVFASKVLGSTNDYWKAEFAAQNKSFTEPKLVLFRSATQSGCGMATSDVGPHYCPPDTTIYLDETFFAVLQQQFGANVGDVAQAYVIAHESGHHAQNLLGIMERVQNDPNYQATGDNSLSVKLELQADCFAGLWANSLKDKGVFEQNEISEAISAAGAVGDDRIQKTTTGRVNPETWTHGSSQERIDAFNNGYDNGKFAVCSTI